MFVDRVGYLIVLLLSLSVHEWAHAVSAFRLGDDTAAREGRLTLNPLAHMDMVGTLLLPLLGVPFGWARPVPVDARRFREGVDVRRGMMITAVAGPLSNLVLALSCALVIGLLFRAFPEGYANSSAVGFFLGAMIQINLALALFNMLPVPPLDGSRVADGLMPSRYRPLWERFCQVGPVALLLVIFVLPMLGIHVLSGPLQYFRGLTVELIQIIAFT